MDFYSFLFGVYVGMFIILVGCAVVEIVLYRKEK